jgi:hypothetical protein
VSADPDSELLRRLRAALDGHAQQVAPGLVDEALAEATEEARGLLRALLTNALLEHAARHLPGAPAEGAGTPRRRSARGDAPTADPRRHVLANIRPNVSRSRPKSPPIGGPPGTKQQTTGNRHEHRAAGWTPLQFPDFHPVSEE